MTSEDPEFSRTYRIDTIDRLDDGILIEADAAERAALAKRFDLASIDSLSAQFTFVRRGAEIALTGSAHAEIRQYCAISGEPFPVSIEEPLSIIFLPASAAAESQEERELAEEECDTVEYSGGTIDVGEAVAQSVYLALDPYATGPDADAARRETGLLTEEQSGPFAALAQLRDKAAKS